MRPPNHDPAAVSAAFERADAIVALEGFVPDAGYRAIQRRVIAGELTSEQAVQLIIEQAQAADRASAAPRSADAKRSHAALGAIVVPMDHLKP